MYVVRQRLERRNVDNVGFVCKRAGTRRAHESIDANQKCGERFSGASGCGDENVAAGGDLGPALQLGLGRVLESGVEPFGDERIETGEGHGFFYCDMYYDIG